MKTRIKVLRMADESVRYIPQYKGWFFWKGWTDNYNEQLYEFPNEAQAKVFIAERIEVIRKATVIATSVIEM